jgi:hypothetical protein
VLAQYGAQDHYLRMYLEAGGSPNEVNHLNQTVAFNLVRMLTPRAITRCLYLIDHGLDLARVDHRGYTCIALGLRWDGITKWEPEQVYFFHTLLDRYPDAVFHPHVFAFALGNPFATSVVQRCLRCGVSPRTPIWLPGASMAFPPLHLISLQYPGNPDHYEILCKQGADVDAQDTCGRTALFTCRSKECVQALIRARATLCHHDLDGNNALMFRCHVADRFITARSCSLACRGSTTTSNADLIIYLVEIGLSIDLKNAYGFNAIMLANQVLRYESPDIPARMVSAASECPW